MADYDFDFPTLPEPDIDWLDPDLLYELCGACQGTAHGCPRCWDEGLVIHACSTEG